LPIFSENFGFNELKNKEFMGPLIPQGIISQEWNFVFAFFIGIAFGFILERAGFSSSRKLAGVFYGYDFVVLRVFFTAAITAMSGLFILNYFGKIDLSAIFVNPFYLWSTVIGGAIMGVGFIIGGFCPGTSAAGASIGKIDAWYFIIGMFLGIFIFAELYPIIFESLHLGKFDPEAIQNSSRIRMVYEDLGISRGLFAFILIAVALSAFYITAIIEKRVTSKTAETNE